MSDAEYEARRTGTNLFVRKPEGLRTLTTGIKELLNLELPLDTAPDARHPPRRRDVMTAKLTMTFSLIRARVHAVVMRLIAEGKLHRY